MMHKTLLKMGRHTLNSGMAYKIRKITCNLMGNFVFGRKVLRSLKMKENPTRLAEV
jgi:hypothetical protein